MASQVNETHVTTRNNTNAHERQLTAGARLSDVPEPGERLLLPCVGGPSVSRLVRWPAPIEVEERDGTYALVDHGPPAT